MMKQNTSFTSRFLRSVAVGSMLVLLSAHISDAKSEEYKMGTGRHLVEIGCTLPKPSTECSMAITYFAVALGFASQGHCHVLKGKQTLSAEDLEDCNKKLFFGMCVRKIESPTKAEALAAYLKTNPSALDEPEIQAVAKTLLKYFECPQTSAK